MPGLKKPTPAKPAFTWELVSKKTLRLQATECLKVSSPAHSSSGEYWFMQVDEEGLALYTSTYPDCSGPYNAEDTLWLNDEGGLTPEKVLDHLDALEGLIAAFRNSVNMAGQS